MVLLSDIALAPTPFHCVFNIDAPDMHDEVDHVATFTGSEVNPLTLLISVEVNAEGSTGFPGN